MQSTEGNVTHFERLGLKGGLSEAQITTILQDSQGFLWLGTRHGLNKYDGYQFSVYYHDPANPDSLTDSQVTTLVEDSQDFLWVGTQNGLNRFDKRSERFRRYPMIADDGHHLTDYCVNAVIEDGDGFLWAGTVQEGLLRLDKQTGQFAVYRHREDDPHSLPHNHVSAILKDSRGVLWVGTLGGGLCRFDRQTEQFEVHRHDRDRRSLRGNLVTTLFEDVEGTLWIGTQGGGVSALRSGGTDAAVRYEHDENASQSLSNDRINCFVEDGSGSLWIGTHRGLNRLDVQTGHFQSYYHHENDLHSLSHSEILSLATDAQGNIWIGTRTGLDRFDPTTLAFGHLRRDVANPNSLSGNLITALFVDSRDTLWVGTYGAGLNKRIAQDPPQFVHFGHRAGDPHSLEDIHALPGDDSPRPFGDNGIYAILEDSRGSLWLGTGAGLHSVVPGDTPGGPPVFIRYPGNKELSSSLTHLCVRAIAEDDKGNLWIGTVGSGLYNLVPGGDAVLAHYQHNPNDPHSLSSDHVIAIHCDARGGVWVGTQHGLNQVVTDGGVHFVRYQRDQEGAHSISNNIVTCMCEDTAGTLWIGTANGLNRFDPQTGRFVSYGVRDGLVGNFIDGLLMDDHGCLWMSTNRGISKFDPGTGRSSHYDTDDGLQADEFTVGACCLDQHGTLRFGGQNGLNAFHPDAIQENTYIPPVLLTSFLLANKPLPISDSGPLKEHIAFTEQIELAPEDYIFAFEFSALNYRQPQKNRFAYQLEGFDRNWIHTDARDRKAVYTNVPPGAYTFRVKAANDDGLWNEEGRSIQVTVSQPWWHILFRSAFEAVVIHDGRGILQVNQAALELLGYEQAELIGQSIYKLIAPEGHEQVAQRVSSGDETPYEVVGLRKDGSALVAEVRGRAIPYQGRVVRVAALRDITERKRAEKALQQSEAKFRGFVEQSADGIFVVDEDGSVIEWNRSLEEITGLTRQEVLGKPAWDVQYRLVVDDERTAETYDQFKAAMLGALQAGEAPWLDETVRAIYQRADGAVRHVEQRMFPIQTDRGFRIGGISADITERREAEAQLRTLSRAVEQSDSTIVVTNLDGTIEFVNPAFTRTTGYAAQEAMGQNPRILKSGQMSPEVYTALWQTISQGRVWEGELLNKRKNGETYWESTIISPVRDGSGNVTHYVAVKQDITARKRTEQALERRVRHEQGLAACSQVLLKRADPQPLNRELLNEALAAVMEAARASRAYVFRNFEDPGVGFSSGIVAEAVAPGLARDLENPYYQKIPWSWAPEQNRLALQAGQTCGGPTERLFASTPELLSDLMKMGILSVQFFPIHFGDEWWGYLGFDDCQTAREWDAEEILVLRTASQMIGSALQRWQAEAALQKAHDELDQQVQARTAELNNAVVRLRREVEQRQLAEAEVRERLAVQQGLASISTRLMQATELDDALADVLAETGALIGANRVFLVRLQADGRTIYRIHEWCASGIAPIFQGVQGWTLPKAPWWFEHLREPGWFYVDDVSQAPREFDEELLLLGGNVGGAMCAIPVYARQEMIGFLGCHGLAAAGRSSDQHLQVLEVIVGILGSAWLRERILETLDQRIAARTRELSTFFDLTTLAIGIQDLSDMLAPIPGRILELRSCDAMCIHLLDAERTTLTLATQGNLPPEMRQRLEAIALESDFLRRLEQRGEPLMTTDQAGAAPLPPQLHLEGFSSYLGVPLPGGWVSYYRTSPHGFSLDESSLLLALAEQVGVSVENYRLRQRIEAAVTLEERGRLARDLHDSVTQSLYSVSLFARSGRDAFEDGDTDRLSTSLTRLEATALQALREMRLLLYELRPEALEQEGLIRTLERRFDAVERRAGIKATVIHQVEGGPELSQTLERELYYLLTEALNNTLKHAQATEVAVRVWLSASQVRLEIADDGRGFDPHQGSGGYGLGDMRERIERLGGRLEISSAPGAGTRIVAWVNLVEV